MVRWSRERIVSFFNESVAILFPFSKISSELIYPIISDKIRELTLDSFGNYFIQKIIEQLSINQLNVLPGVPFLQSILVHFPPI